MLYTKYHTIDYYYNLAEGMYELAHKSCYTIPIVNYKLYMLCDRNVKSQWLLMAIVKYCLGSSLHIVIHPCANTNATEN